MHVANYADDKTPYSYGENIECVIKLLEQSAYLLFDWFKSNQMKSNEKKYHVLLSTDETLQVNIGNSRINNSNCEKLLGIKIDWKLSLNDHIENKCKKTGAKLNTLTRVTQYMNTEKKRSMMNALFLLQFNYCPLTWMFHNRSLNHKKNRLHERCLRVIYNDSHSCYDESLNLDNSVSVHHRNLQISATTMFRVYTGSATDILNEVFLLKPRLNCNLSNQLEFAVRPIKSVRYGLNSLAYLGPRIWELLLNNLKRLEPAEAFKSTI